MIVRMVIDDVVMLVRKWVNLLNRVVSGWLSIQMYSSEMIVVLKIGMIRIGMIGLMYLCYGIFFIYLVMQLVMKLIMMVLINLVLRLVFVLLGFVVVRQGNCVLLLVMKLEIILMIRLGWLVMVWVMKLVSIGIMREKVNVLICRIVCQKLFLGMVMLLVVGLLLMFKVRVIMMLLQIINGIMWDMLVMRVVYKV